VDPPNPFCGAAARLRIVPLSVAQLSRHGSPAKRSAAGDPQLGLELTITFNKGAVMVLLTA
jgi:hypothetical protein